MSNKFISINDKILNLDKVTSIGFLEDRQRIVFNLSHSIQVLNKNHTSDDNKYSLIADYKYWDFDSKYKYKDKIQKLIVILNSLDFFISTAPKHYTVNPKNVSYITFDELNNRIIFNLPTSVTKKTTGLLTNDYVFWTFNDKDEYIKNKLIIDERFNTND